MSKIDTPMNGQSEDHDKPREVTVALQTVGCKLNQAESESMVRKFVSAGFKVVAPKYNPDIYILNTCTVTHIADRKCRQYLRSFRRRNPNSLIVAVGCYVDSSDGALVQEIDLAVGNKQKNQLVEIVKSHLDSELNCFGGNGHNQKTDIFRTRAFIKIQDGCSHGCSYCIVPSVRGPEESVPVEQIITEIKARVEEGCKEVVLTGTRIGAYNNQGDLENLLRRILNETSVPRIRLSSLQPRELTESLITLWGKNERICNHLHLALQSGSDSILSKMNRGYSINEYEYAVNLIRNAVPDIAVTTDIIVGFPGEGEKEFDESYDFCENIAFANMHVFPYSVRAGTPAAGMANKVADKVKKFRSQKMLDLAKRNSESFRSKFNGRAMMVLWEECNENDIWVGHTDNYIKIFTKKAGLRENSLLETMLGSEYDDGMWGEVCNIKQEVAAR